MTFQFRDAVRADTRLLIGLAGGTGAGKTESAMRLATGLARGEKFAVIDTESGRALHKADDYKFKHGDLTAPFTPERYWEAIEAADKEGFPVIVIDSFSHVWEGVGGVLQMQEEELEKLGGSPAMAPKSWIKPKSRHRRLVNQMLQVRAHLIVCMRAQDKIEIVKQDGKTVIRPAHTLTGADGWVPICERRFPHELTLSLLLLQGAPGVPKPIKLESRHKASIPLDRQLDESVGLALADWARGGEPKQNGQLTELPGETFEDIFQGSTVTQQGDEKATESQKKKLDVLVGQLREADKLHTEHLYMAVSKMRDADQTIALVGEDGELHWGPLRDTLTKDEASSLVDRLSRLQENVKAT